MRVDEEVVLLEEQLAAAHGDVERLQARLEEAEAKATSMETEASDARCQLVAASAAASERDAMSAALEARIADVEEQAGRDAVRYRDLLLASEPDLPAELVLGDTVEAIEQSLVQARQTVAQVRQHIEQQAQALRVPAGAPIRSRILPPFRRRRRSASACNRRDRRLVSALKSGGNT